MPPPEPGSASLERRGTLFVVATPIGNLEDITLRALRILKSVSLVCAEDTRRSGNLLRHYGIQTPLLSLHEHNERARAPQLIARLAAGEAIALVTDAGTPGISDPGAQIVALVRAAGFRVEPIPGPSAVTAALSASGVESDGFTFLGFAPIRGKNRKKWLDGLVLASMDRAVVFYEAPHRLEKTLDDVGKLVDRPIILFRELTKAHEEVVCGLPNDLKTMIGSSRGEFTLVIPPRGSREGVVSVVKDDDVLCVFGQITEQLKPRSKREGAKLVAEQLGLTTKQVYGVLEKHKIGQ